MLKVSISLAILSEIFIQIGNYSRSYVRKQKWMFFSEHSVYDELKYSYDSGQNSVIRHVAKLHTTHTIKQALPIM